MTHPTPSAPRPRLADPAASRPAESAPPRAAEPGQSFAAIARRQFLRNRLAVGGLIIVLILATVAVWCPLLATDKPYYVRAVFAEEYENAYYSALDLMGRMARFEKEGLGPGETPVDLAQSGRLLVARMRDMESSLEPGAARAVEDLRKNAATRIFSMPTAGSSASSSPAPSSSSSAPSSSPVSSAEAPPAAVAASPDAASPWTEWRAALQSAAAPDRAALVPRALFPAFKALGGMEIFFMVLWTAGLLVWTTGFWRRGGRAGLIVLFIPALVVATVWRIANPPVTDTTDYRGLIERPQTPVSYLRAPVPFGENENLTREANQPPTWILADAKRVESQHFHVLGTDPSGRDVLGRMIYGTRISMLIGIVAVSIYIAIGILVGAVAGYFGGWVDIAVSRAIEIVICFPTLFLLLILLAYIRPNIYTIMAALGLISWTGVARLERGEFLRLVNQDFVQAVRALGGGSMRIIFRHILPNALGPVLVSASFGIAGSILAESTLSFLGFGVPPDQASWGGLLKIGNENIQELWWMVLFPGVALFTTVTCFNLVGEGVRDATDPRLIQ